jgi:DNA segregation ATPase FtsK/SpoIIIE, S-DNA-T family
VLFRSGFAMLGLSLSAALSFIPFLFWGGAVHAGGALGSLLARYLLDILNLAGSIVLIGCAMFVSLYLVSSFSLSRMGGVFALPAEALTRMGELWQERKERAAARQIEKTHLRELKRQEKEALKAAKEAEKAAKQAGKEARKRGRTLVAEPLPAQAEAAMLSEPEPESDGRLPWATYPETPAPPAYPQAVEEPPAPPAEIPICLIEETVPPVPLVPLAGAPVRSARAARETLIHPAYQLPSTELLNEVPPRNPFDEQELKDTAAKIKAKFQEFNVLGNVVQINPGPVVTTFEFKPEAGIKYSRIIALTEDLCLGLQAESILIERIPGKPTVGIEVPNTRREVIALRQMLESDEFQQSQSRLTFPLGKDINGRIRMAALDTMPHLLIAGSTGSGKSVMLNSLIMSILYKATPDQVRLIMVDPKRLELGLYEGIPHLLTPVITDPKKASNALRNAVLEMERRLRLLAEYGVRNIEQFNKKIRRLQDEPRDLFADESQTRDEVKTLPYIMIVIDELADLMMIEGRNVEETVTRLAQMARAVGMHLVLATQRPSVDVITGLIKANFPARISFRVATRVDSRTILDVMGAEHLLGKGDMLFLPPGSSRLTRLHGAFVTETDIAGVVDFWKEQAEPEYDQSFLVAPPSEEDDELAETEVDAEQDPMYEEAIRLVLQMGKASTSTLQRHLRLGYGRAARILDMMQRDGIIGPPDGSKPREVLKRPDWLVEVEGQLR